MSKPLDSDCSQSEERDGQMEGNRNVVRIRSLCLQVLLVAPYGPFEVEASPLFVTLKIPTLTII